VTDNYDLFQHESKTKETIYKLRNSIKEKDRQIEDYKVKL